MRTIAILFSLICVSASAWALSPYPDQDLVKAIEKQDRFEALRALEAGANPNFWDERGGPRVIMSAAEGGDVEIVRSLLMYGADPNLLDKTRETPLHALAGYCYRGDTLAKQRAAVIQALVAGGAISTGASANELQCGFAPGNSTRKGMTPLALAIRSGYPDILREILKISGLDLRASGMGRAPILLAVPSGHIPAESIRLLLAAGVDAKVTDADGNSPLHLEMRAPKGEVISLLLKAGLDPRALNGAKQSPFWVGVASNAPRSVLELLIKAGADARLADASGSMPIHHAARSGSLENITYLLSLGADPNALDGSGLSPLWHAVAQKASIPMLEALLKAGGKVDFSSSQGDGLLHQAVMADSPAVAEFLVKAGAPVNQLNKRGEGALFQAIAAKRNLDWIQLLFKLGADANADGGAESSAFVAAARTRDVSLVKLLIAQGAQPARHGLAALEVALLQEDLAMAEFLISTRLDLNAPYRGGSLLGRITEVTPSRYPKPSGVALLLAAKADPNAADSKGYTPLSYAAQRMNGETVRALIAAGAKVDHLIGPPMNSQETALTLSVKAKNREAFEALLTAGANANLPKPASPLILAVDHSLFGWVPSLIRAGANVNGDDGGMMWKLMYNKELATLRAFLEAGADPNRGKYSLPLFDATERQWLEGVTLLLEFGADVNRSRFETDQFTAVMYAVEKNLLTYAQVLVRAPGFKPDLADRDGRSAIFRARDAMYVNLLADVGASLNLAATDWTGNSPLLEFAGTGNVELVKAAIKRGADVNFVNKRKETAVALAVSSKHDRVALLLCLNGAKDAYCNP